MKHDHLKTAFLSAFLIFGLSAGAEVTPCGPGIEGALHTNYDGSEGGFVASTVIVDKTAFVESDAAVCENARVLGYAQVGGDARVFRGPLESGEFTSGEH